MVPAAASVRAGCARGLADRAGINSNELFAAANIPDAKCFLRRRFDPDGDLVVHAVGLDRVPRRWRQADGPPMSPERWVPAAATLDPFLIEPPLLVTRLPTGGEARRVPAARSDAPAGSAIEAASPRAG